MDNAGNAQKFLKLWDSGAEWFEVFTSGSTGKPKLISLSRKAMMASAEATGEKLEILQDDTIHCCLPTDKISGMMQLVRSRVWNIPVRVAEPSSNPLMNDAPGSLISLTTHQLYTIISNGDSKKKLNQYRIVIIGGGDLQPSLEVQLKDLNPTFCHSYGMTETCSHIALRNIKTERWFYPLPGVEIMQGKTGCLMIRGLVTDGVWIETNDIAEVAKNKFRIIGRADFVINSGGIKIHPEQVENMIYKALNLPENCLLVHGVKDDKTGEKPVLFVNRKMVQKVDLSEIKFPEKYWCPVKIYYLDEFRFLASGKVDRMGTVAGFSGREQAEL